MRIIFTGGGTAGHVNPALYIANYIKKRHKDAKILFVGTENGIEKTLVEKQNIPFKSVKIRGIKRGISPKDIVYNLKTLEIALKSEKEAFKIIKEFKPDLVFGCGGYASFPLIRKASKMGVKTAILEVNAYAGLTTKVLSKNSDVIFTAFSETLDFLKKSVHKKVIKSGSPISEDFLSLEKQDVRNALGIDDKPLVVSFWGSLGALHMNKKMVDFVLLKDDSFNHIHATGKNAYEWFLRDTKGTTSDIREYIYNMEEVLSACDLVISRAGAMTLNELSVMGKPSIVVPSPYVSDNHQEKNARAIEKIGGLKVLLENEVSGKDILNETKKLLNDPLKLSSMSENIKTITDSNSNEKIYKKVLSLIEQK